MSLPSVIPPLNGTEPYTGFGKEMVRPKNVFYAKESKALVMSSDDVPPRNLTKDLEECALFIDATSDDLPNATPSLNPNREELHNYIVIPMTVRDSNILPYSSDAEEECRAEYGLKSPASTAKPAAPMRTITGPLRSTTTTKPTAPMRTITGPLRSTTTTAPMRSTTAAAPMRTHPDLDKHNGYEILVKNWGFLEENL